MDNKRVYGGVAIIGIITVLVSIFLFRKRSKTAPLGKIKIPRSRPFYDTGDTSGLDAEDLDQLRITSAVEEICFYSCGFMELRDQVLQECLEDLRGFLILLIGRNGGLSLEFVAPNRRDMCFDFLLEDLILLRPRFKHLQHLNRIKVLEKINKKMKFWTEDVALGDKFLHLNKEPVMDGTFYRANETTIYLPAKQTGELRNSVASMAFESEWDWYCQADEIGNPSVHKIHISEVPKAEGA